MIFYLKKDKLVFGETGKLLTFVEAGSYEVIRMFDNKRVMINTNHGRPQQVTLLRTKDGEFENA